MFEIRIALAIPTINRKDLLEEALQTYKKTWHGSTIMIIDNGNQNIYCTEPNVIILNSKYNFGVSKSWNKLINNLHKLNYTHVLVVNDDIVFKKTLFQLNEYINLNPADFYIGTGTWCCFLIPIKTYKNIGPFDEKFYPAYFEDMDYSYRIRLKNLTMHMSPFFNPEVYRNSQSIEKEPELNNRFLRNKRYYALKWGGLPGDERYKTPFNGMKAAKLLLNWFKTFTYFKK